MSEENHNVVLSISKKDWRIMRFLFFCQDITLHPWEFALWAISKLTPVAIGAITGYIIWG
jgi:hypothetical protein